eukprot:6376101-Alexandrium_andersonii.AAC.1
MCIRDSSRWNARLPLIAPVGTSITSSATCGVAAADRSEGRQGARAPGLVPNVAEKGDRRSFRSTA